MLAGLTQPPLGQEPVRHEEQGLRRRRGEPLRGVGRVPGLTVVADLEPAGQHLRAQADELGPVGVGQDAGAATARRQHVGPDEPEPAVVVAGQLDRDDDRVPVGAAVGEQAVGEAGQPAGQLLDVDPWGGALRGRRRGDGGPGGSAPAVVAGPVASSVGHDATRSMATSTKTRSW